MELHLKCWSAPVVLFCVRVGDLSIRSVSVGKIAIMPSMGTAITEYVFSRQKFKRTVMNSICVSVYRLALKYPESILAEK